MDIPGPLEYSLEPDNISFINSASNFYTKICEMCRNAKKRIVLSCLYIGTGDLESNLIQEITACKSERPNVTLDVLVDKERQCRSNTLNKEKSPLYLFAPMIKHFDNVKISLFFNPLFGRIMTHFVKSPLSEVFGTMHLKIYISDSTCIITGANLSNEYFVSRYDRYVVIEDTFFADMMHTIVATMQSASFDWTANMEAKWNSNLVNPLDDAMLFRNQMFIKTRTLVEMLHQVIASKQQKPKECRIKIMLQLGFTLPSFDQEERILFDYLYKEAKNGKYVFISTAYLNMTDRLMQVLKKIHNFNHNALQVLTANPRANSFWGCGRLRTLIPLFYSSAACKLIRVLSEGLTHYVENVYMEFYKPNSTFHSKGFWILNQRLDFVPNEEFESFSNRIKGPIYTVVGSSNYGARSYYRDLEITMLLESDSPKVQKHLKEELYSMLEYATYVTYSTVNQRLALSFHVVTSLKRRFCNLTGFIGPGVKGGILFRHKIGLGAKVDLLNIKETTPKNQLAWALFEVSRFTAKLGTLYKKLRIFKRQRRAIVNEFTSDQTELNRITAEKRRIERRLKGYKRALLKDSNPVEPHVPIEFQSKNVSPLFYKLGIAKKQRKHFIPQKEKKETDEKPLREFMNILSQVKGGTFVKERLVPLPPFCTRGGLKKGPRGL
ncbi:bifunctional Phospholipase D-Transphosphatidylase/CDP-alcohol phosphatidyltransferase class-II family/Phospholipase D-like domain [Babesia duncani]|uniref:CDP-diacylglycerol--glycerol-3-phosphate 3-phosphatidyltransferase n=1 Tax=Babesia duncani TaxID=323732 RepID=A0AAD9PNP1_9APIC|nr:bifunctional Phospholipase D-Transphosphatidylase/CDP-alcohol phosphatidyltransferase class-II family/Phospholipase D-like domain [Babesia duncani]